MLKRLIILALSVSALTSAARAHEVSASTVVVHIDASRVEVLQTTPLATMAQVASAMTGTTIDQEAHETLLDAIGQSWQIQGQSAPCRLERQAYRLKHHGAELQARYLFSCEGAERPQVLKANWLIETPSDHFLIFTLNSAETSKTVIFEHQDLAIDISKLN